MKLDKTVKMAVKNAEDEASSGGESSGGGGSASIATLHFPTQNWRRSNRMLLVWAQRACAGCEDKALCGTHLLLICKY
jgi:hypothetical protein